jgi:hypothetical protein
MSDSFQIAIITALINGAVTWGVMSTKLAWLRRDVDMLGIRLDHIEADSRSDNLAARMGRQERRPS